jgi:hypothetical protein
MIYVIISSEFKTPVKRGEKIEHETILKIGYTDDKRGDKRFAAYRSCSPTSQVLYKIPGGTRKDEQRLHTYFKEFKYPKQREWFYYRDEILEFFDIYSTIELIRKEVNWIFIRQGYYLITLKSVFNVKRVMWDNIVANRDVLEPYGGGKRVNYLNYIPFCETEEDLYNLLKSRSKFKYNGANEFKAYELNRSRLTPRISSYVEHMRDVSVPIVQRIKELCEIEEFTLEEKSFIAKMSSEWIDKPYNTLGAERCKELNYNLSDIVRESIIIEEKDHITSEIYKSFSVGMRYSFIEINEKLNKIFRSIGIYTVPGPELLKKYFEVKEISEMFLSDSKTRDAGYEILERDSIMRRKEDYLLFSISRDSEAFKRYRNNFKEVIKELSEDIYSNFEIGKTYTNKEVFKKIDLIEEKHKEYLDNLRSIDKRLSNARIDMFFKIKSYQVAPYDQIDEKGCFINTYEIDILERLEPLE